MTDEDEDYNSSDESSIAEEIANGNGTNLKGQAGQGSKPTFGVLTLEDNEDDVEAFQRPDVVDIYDDVGEGEDDEEEFAGEVEDIEILDDLEKPSSTFKKAVRKPAGSISKSSKAAANSSSASKANNTTNQSNRSDLDDSKKKKKKKR